MAIPRVRITQRPGHGPPGLALRGRTKPEFVSGPDGQLWIRKLTSPTNMFAEALAFLLGRELDVPIPDGAISQPTRGWLSQFRQSYHWDAIHRGSITNIQGLGHCLALDVLIGNSDRHSENILVEVTGDLEGNQPRTRVWCIDHEGCWLSDQAVLTALSARGQTTKRLVCANQPRDLPLDELEKAALDAARVAERLARRIPLLADEAETAARCGTTHRDIASDFLAQRCLHGVQLTEQYLADLETHCS